MNLILVLVLFSQCGDYPHHIVRNINSELPRTYVYAHLSDGSLFLVPVIGGYQPNEIKVYRDTFGRVTDLELDYSTRTVFNPQKKLNFFECKPSARPPVLIETPLVPVTRPLVPVEKPLVPIRREPEQPKLPPLEPTPALPRGPAEPSLPPIIQPQDNGMRLPTEIN